MRIRGSRAGVALIMLAAVAVRPSAAQEASDSVAIAGVVADYIQGWREGDTARLGLALAPDGILMWRQGDRVSTRTFQEILQKRKPLPGYGEPWTLLSLDIFNGDVAVAEARIAGKGPTAVDVLTLYKLERGWRIVNKAFTYFR